MENAVPSTTIGTPLKTSKRDLKKNPPFDEVPLSHPGQF